MEQQLKVDYRRLIEEIVAKLVPHNHSLAVQLARIPEDIRGYGHVIERHFKAAKVKEAGLKVEFDSAKVVIGIATQQISRAA